MGKENSGKDDGHVTVGTTVPALMVKSLDRIVEGGMYKDRADLIREALRDKILQHKGGRDK